jgi:hypothetical protein
MLLLRLQILNSELINYLLARRKHHTVFKRCGCWVVGMVGVVWYVERAIKAKKTHTFNYARTQ